MGMLLCQVSGKKWNRSAFNYVLLAICQTYSDAGLLGAMVVTEAASAGKVVGAVAAALRSATVTEEEVAAAKKIMLADVYTLLEDPLQQVENMGAQVCVGIGHDDSDDAVIAAVGVRICDAR